MRQSIVVKTCIGLAALAVIGGYMVLGGKMDSLPSNIGTLLTPIPSTPSTITSTPQLTMSVFSVLTPSADTSTWKTYRNEEYGIIFKYPDNLTISEGSSIWNGGESLGIKLVPNNQESNDNGNVEPKISITSVCLVPENVPKRVWEALST
jgi:hypothetical protein